MILTKRDRRTVYHWPLSIQELIEAQKKIPATDPYNYMSKEGQAFDELHSAAEDASGHWQLCAIGSICRAIPRIKDEDGNWHEATEYPVDIIPELHEPKDHKLRSLGLDFDSQIRNANFQDALKTMGKIEKRAIQILTKMGKIPKTYGKPIK